MATWASTAIKNPIDIYIACWEWGKYLGEEALAEGVDVCVSSWTRMAPNTLPALAKAGANYMNSQLIRMEARINGYTEGIALDTHGYVSEGSGENIFVVRDGKIHHAAAGRERAARHHARQRPDAGARRRTSRWWRPIIPREMLYIADEVFFTGTAAEITPIRSIDRIKIGSGQRGPVAERLQKEFFGIIDGTREDTHGWLSPVHATPLRSSSRTINGASHRPAPAIAIALTDSRKRRYAHEDCATTMTTSPEICHPGCAAT